VQPQVRSVTKTPLLLPSSTHQWSILTDWNNRSNPGRGRTFPIFSGAQGEEGQVLGLRRRFGRLDAS